MCTYTLVVFAVTVLVNLKCLPALDMPKDRFDIF